MKTSYNFAKYLFSRSPKLLLFKSLNATLRQKQKIILNNID